MSDSRDFPGSGLMLFILGAAVVALTTPKSGPELRSDLKDLGIRVRDRARRLGQDLCATADEMADGVTRG
ncbi:YtxH domain-containing protein [Mesoterricola sediminis]|uniref:YtxH domain-containing protein n=1 Tax=Mesoterricola sediminis TaxID=2927980 RepID=A0AA48HID1_9BACT|nr:YtxH domain-containing protein [Mesoterricola sediminis]BDU78753.1 hypothetical protein METESE_37110 [Mesoterricola sediminis]